MNNGKWRLPHGVDELLPPAAGAMERLRRDVLDLFVSWGYEHIEPPLVEYLDSLLVGSGADLDLQTLKAVDQRTGRMLGVRADMTSQAVRIDAHSRLKDGVQRLCYAGPVVFANPQGALDSRNPFKAGAEIFGSASLQADAEVIRLMLAALQAASVEKPVLLLGHMGIYRALVAELDLDETRERQLFGAIQRKAETDVAGLLPQSKHRELLVSLPTMMGDASVLDAARERFAGAPAPVLAALDDLQHLAQSIARTESVEVRFDLAELSGYGYHNGPVFAAYQADQGASLAQGGRYDSIGGHFGRARPATGFDIRLMRLLAETPPQNNAIWAPFAPEDQSLLAAVGELRAQRKVVVCALSEEESPDERCANMLVAEGGRWVVKNLEADRGT